VHFYIGNVFHAACEGQALGLDPIATAEAYCTRKRAEYAARYAEQQGQNLGPHKLHQLKEPEELAFAMIRSYFDRWGWDNPLRSHGLRYIAPEISFRIPIPGVTTPDGTQVHLVGTIDGLAEEIDDPTHIWGVEHKTYSQAAELKNLMFDDQMLGYAWAVWQLLGQRPVGFLYDGANKVKPKVPKVLTGDGPRKGRLSVAIEGAMTYAAYHAAILELDQNPTDPDYLEVLRKLKLRAAMDETAFHRRYQLQYGEYQLREWEGNLITDAREMVETVISPGRITPNRKWDGCWDCDVQDLCSAISLGEDLDWLIETEYTEGTYGTRSAQKDMEPETVGSLADLRAVVERRRQALLAG
jgi:hypothetical protein